MSYSLHFDPGNQIVLARFEGRVTDELLTEFQRIAARRIVATMGFRGTIVDFSEVTAFDVSRETVRMLAWEEPPDPDTSRPRIMVAPQDHVYGLCRIFASHGEDTRPNLHVVRSLEHAYAILGMAKPGFEAVKQPGSADD